MVWPCAVSLYVYVKKSINLCQYKHRPKLLPQYPELKAADALKNIELAQEAALKYFQLDKFLTPSDVTKLDGDSIFLNRPHVKKKTLWWCLLQSFIMVLQNKGNST